MLEVKNLSIVIDNKEIIKDLSFVLNLNDKIAVIGEEGNGKSTLLKAICNCDLVKYASVKGIIKKNGNQIYYLEQFIDSKYYNLKVHDYLFKDEEDYYNKLNSLYKHLETLSISDSILSSIINNLSGGEKVKIQLLKMLLAEADILVLDEPTNDLDIDTLKWLEDFIISSKKPIIYVSHDEYLLSKTANMIIHLELLKKKREPRSSVVRCSYDEYVDSRLNHIKKETQIAKKETVNYKKQHEKLMQIMNKVHYELNTISRGNPHGAKMLKRKMKSLKSQENRLENKELTQVPDVEDSINIFFDTVNIPSKKKIIDLTISLLTVDDLILAKNIDLKVFGGEHIVIIGKNGCGKTTLIRQIYDGLKDRDDISLGYMPQNYEEVLDYNISPIEFLANTHDKEETTRNRCYLGNINFTNEEMNGPIKSLSGGSKAKLMLLKLIINKCNVLLLDEPTRNVSPLSNPIIRKMLSDFGGTIISVSHDRKYIEEVCHYIYMMDYDGLHKL